MMEPAVPWSRTASRNERYDRDEDLKRQTDTKQFCIDLGHVQISEMDINDAYSVAIRR